MKITLKGDPTAQARVRVFKRGNRVMTFDPQTAFKKNLKYLVQDQVDDQKTE